jgi:plasmid stabilization system protein ParE
LKFQVSKKAFFQIEDIYLYHSKKFNVSRAEKILSSIDNIFKKILKNHEAYSKYLENTIPERNIRKAIVRSKYNIIFEVFEDKILILYVFHTAMDLKTFKIS